MAASVRLARNAAAVAIRACQFADGPLVNRAEPELFASREAIGQAVGRVASEISQQCSDGAVLVSVLKGSLPFLADLVRTVDIAVEVDFLALSRFAPDSGRVRLVKDLDCDVGGRQVVLVEDIVDTGLSLGYLMGELHRRSAASVAVAALLNRSARRILPVEPDYVALRHRMSSFWLRIGLGRPLPQPGPIGYRRS